MGVLKVDTHALERDLFPLLIGHLIGIARDLNLLKHLTHGDGQDAVATLPYLLRTTVSVLRNHLGRDHNRHVALGERIRINEHHMVAPKEDSLEIGVAKRVVRQQLDLRIIGQRHPAAQVCTVEACAAKRLNRRIVLEPRGSKARAIFERSGAN